MAGSFESKQKNERAQLCQISTAPRDSDAERIAHVGVEPILLDAGAWLGNGEYRQLDLGIVLGIEVARLRVTPNDSALTRTSGGMCVSDGPKCAQMDPLSDLLFEVGNETGCGFSIESKCLRPWFSDEVKPEDYAATGLSASDAILFVGDTHFGLRNWLTDDAMASDTGNMCDISNGEENLSLLLKVLSAFKSRGVTIVQLGDFFDLWESEYALFLRHWNTVAGTYRTGHARQEYDRLYKEALNSEKYAKQAEREIRNAWGAPLEQLLAMIKFRVRGNHDWKTSSSTIDWIDLGIGGRIRAEHGHRFDGMNSYDDFGVDTSATHPNASPPNVSPPNVSPPRGKKLTWSHAEEELSGNMDHEHNHPFASLESVYFWNVRELLKEHAASEVGIVGNRVSGNREQLKKAPRVYVMGHTHHALIQVFPNFFNFYSAVAAGYSMQSY